MTRRDDRGSATVWVLGCAAVVFAVAAVVLIRSLAVLARHRAEAAADFAALAAATAIGTGTDPCTAASRLARENHSTLQRCSVSLDADTRSGTVVVGVRSQVALPLVGAQAVNASARAARLPASADRSSSPARGGAQ